VQINSKMCPSMIANNGWFTRNLVCQTFNVPATCSGCVETYSGSVATLTCALCAGGQASTSINTNACPTANVRDYYGQLTCINANCNAYVQANENNVQQGDSARALAGAASSIVVSSTFTVALIAMVAALMRQ